MEDNVFDNMNHGKTLTTLSLINGKTYPIAESALADIYYPTFDNHGQILNLQGYPGGVTVLDNSFTNNLVYIPDIFPSKRSTSDSAD